MKNNKHVAILYLLVILLSFFYVDTVYLQPDQKDLPSTDYQDHPVMMQDIDYLKKRVTALEIEVGVSVDYRDQ